VILSPGSGDVDTFVQFFLYIFEDAFLTCYCRPCWVCRQHDFVDGRFNDMTSSARSSLMVME